MEEQPRILTVEEKIQTVEVEKKETAAKNTNALRTLTLCSGKGGVGKTLLTASLARIFRREGDSNILLVDLDMAVRGLTLLAFQHKSVVDAPPRSFADYLFSGPIAGQELLEDLRKIFDMETEERARSFYQRLEKIFILPSSLENEQPEWGQPARLEFDQAVAKLRQIQTFVRQSLPVGYLIFDTQAGLGSLSLAAATISDVNLIVLEEDDISWRTALTMLVEILNLSKRQQSKAKSYFLANKASPGLLDVAKKLKPFSFLPPLLYDFWLQRLFAQASSSVFDEEFEHTNFFRQIDSRLRPELFAALGVPKFSAKTNSRLGTWWQKK
ncbi:MAG: AAA family ATPase [Candidatus Binatia bacterium]